ncbi:MAG: Oligopeptide transport system permease protein OppC [Frankiales bacterium]|nr:Oligopeptide transport system permease protein OppC [Frankiales bacterium]
MSDRSTPLPRVQPPLAGPDVPGGEQIVAGEVVDVAVADAVAVAGTGDPGTGKPRSLWSDAWHDLRRRPIFLVSAALITGLLLVALFPGLFTNTDPKFCDLKYSDMGAADGHPFGCNRQGCDVYARTLYGARPSIMVGLLTTLGAVLVGGLIGALAGFYGGFVDSVLSRVTDIFFAIPLVLGAIVFLSAFPNRNVWTVVLALVVLGWTQIARIMRGAVISVKEADFVVAARALGASDRRILTRHILPNAVAPVIVVATISLGIYIVAEATLSFLGLGLPPDTVSWGGDISDAQLSLRTAPHVLLFPAGALSLTVLSFIMLGDAVRDALDPRLR